MWKRWTDEGRRTGEKYVDLVKFTDCGHVTRCRYVESFRPDLMEVVAAWLRGVRFADLVKMTKVFEVCM